MDGCFVDCETTAMDGRGTRFACLRMGQNMVLPSKQAFMIHEYKSRAAVQMEVCGFRRGLCHCQSMQKKTTIIVENEGACCCQYELPIFTNMSCLFLLDTVVERTDNTGAIVAVAAGNETFRGVNPMTRTV
jgi:hypothetical protein